MNSIHITTLRSLCDILRSSQTVHYQSNRRSRAPHKSPTHLLIPAEILLGPRPFAGPVGEFLDRLRRHRKRLAKLRQCVATGDRVSLLIQKRDGAPTATQRQYLREILPGVRFVTVQTPAEPSAVPSDTVAPADHHPAE